MPEATMPATAKNQEIIKKRSWWKYVLGALLALFIVIGAWAWMSKGAVVSAAKDFIVAVQAGDEEAAYALTTEGFHSYTSLEQLATVIDENWSLLPKTDPKIADYYIQASTDDGQTARVIAEWPKDDGGLFLMIMKLAKEDGLWLISAAKTDELAAGQTYDPEELAPL